MADVTRHGQDAPGGVMETIIHKAFQVFKKEGVEFGRSGGEQRQSGGTAAVFCV